MSSSKVKLWWEVQKNGGWKTLTNHLSRSANVHKHFDSFIKTFYWRFRSKKGIPRGSYNPEIDFQGFKEFSTNEQGEMGHCASKTLIHTINGNTFYHQTISITIGQLYLLDKLGMDKFISNYSSKTSSNNWSSLDISFDKLIETIAHELAHAYQNTINIKEKMQSQCESSGKKNKKGELLYPQLAFEHTRLTEEIRQMIIGSSEHQNFKKWWVEKNSPQESDEELNDNHDEIPLKEMKPCESCGKINRWNCCDKCAREQKGFDHFFSLIQNSKDLTTLENNYQSVKNNPHYNGNNKAKLDNIYNATKNYLQTQNSQENHWWKGNGELVWFLVIITAISLIMWLWLTLFGQKEKKKRY